MFEYKKFLSLIWNHKHGKRYMVGFAAGATVLLILAFKNLFLLGSLIFFNIVISIFNRPLKKFYVGFEVVTFSTVIAGMVYGPMMGFIFGMVSLLVNFVFMRRITMFTILVLPAYGLIGLLAPLFSVEHISTVGIGFSVLYNVLVSFVILFFFRGKWAKCLLFSSTNILFNVLLFVYVAPFFIKVML